jgi:hypothetical protein
LNVAEARTAVPHVAQVMGDTLGWSKKQRDEQIQHALSSLVQFTAE